VSSVAVWQCSGSEFIRQVKLEVPEDEERESVCVFSAKSSATPLFIYLFYYIVFI
jgi:hypothetical protein